MYLKQSPVATKKDAGWLCTYGDHYDDNTAADLRGRKFYYHQPGPLASRVFISLIREIKVHWQEGQENKTTPPYPFLVGCKSHSYSRLETWNDNSNYKLALLGTWRLDSCLGMSTRGLPFAA